MKTSGAKNKTKPSKPVLKAGASRPKAAPKPKPVTDEPEAPQAIEYEPISLSLDTELAVGHRPSSARGVEREKDLFRAFQSNLLSMISHELRTPLMGVLNSLSVFEAGEDGSVRVVGDAMPPAEALSMARRNAERLQQSLNVLLDLAAIEAGAFHIRLREVAMARLVRQKADAWKARFEGRAIEIVEEKDARPVLADPSRLVRLIELVISALARWASVPDKIQLRISSSAISITAKPSSEDEIRRFEDAWVEAQTAAEAGVGSTGSAFGATVQSEREFLSRGDEEGMGGELMLALEIARLHRATLTREAGDGERIGLRLEFPELVGRERLRAVLSSRTFHAASDLASVMIILIEVPKGTPLAELQARAGKALFRESDEVYAYPAAHKGEPDRIALVLHDCKRDDAPGLMGRVIRTLQSEARWGFAHCPSDSLDSAELVEIAQRRAREQG